MSAIINMECPTCGQEMTVQEEARNYVITCPLICGEDAITQCPCCGTALSYPTEQLVEERPA